MISINILRHFQPKPHAPIMTVQPYNLADSIAFLAISHTFNAGDMVYNARLNTYAQVIRTVPYAFPVYDADGEYLGFGDDLGIDALYVGFEWADGNKATAYWLAQDVELLTDAHMELIEGVA